MFVINHAAAKVMSAMRSVQESVKGAEMNKLEVIKHYAGTLPAEKIAELIDMSASGVRTLACRNNISLRAPAKVSVGNPCAKCGSNLRYSRGECVECKKALKNKRYFDPCNVWLKRKWI